MKTYNRKRKKIVCNTCGEMFEKTLSEIKRTEKKGGKHYCSLKCNGQNSKKNLGDNLGKGNVSYLKHNNKRDKYTGFREFLRRARNRNKLGDLSLEDLKNQWILQNGICPYTGIKLQLPSTKRNEKILLFELASLDRIDSSKLYEKNNVVFVSVPINYMKNSMSENETILLCKKIALFWENKK